MLMSAMRFLKLTKKKTQEARSVDKSGWKFMGVGLKKLPGGGATFRCTERHATLEECRQELRRWE
jgi:hypothetical protein